MLSLQLAQNEWLKEIHNDAVYTRGIVNILYTKTGTAFYVSVSVRGQ